MMQTHVSYLYDKPAISKSLKTPTKATLYAILLVLFIGSILSFIQFRTFKVADGSKPIEQQTQNSIANAPDDIPAPKNSTELSSNISSSSGQVVFQTTEDVGNVYTYYKNILLGKDWTIKQDEKNDFGMVTKYIKDQSQVIVTLTKNTSSQDKTIVSIEYSKN